MLQMQGLVPLAEIEIEQNAVLQLKRQALLEILNDQYKLNHYADPVVQAQAVLLNGIDPQLTQQLSQSIEALIQNLASAKKYLKPRKFNALQKWLGIDLDYGSGQVEYYKNLDRLLDQTNHLSQKLQIELQKSQSRFQQLQGLRKTMAQHIVAAEEFLIEYPSFGSQQFAMQHFSERLAKKIHSLRTLQSSNDIAIQQMLLSQQLSLSLLDRFKEAQQVLIPAWQYHVKQSLQQHNARDVEQLNQSREKLIRSLKHSLADFDKK